MKKKPNVIFLMSDQMAQSVVMPGSQCIMPNVQKLVSDSIVCTNAYTSNPICSPARASLMTGLLPHAHGMVDVTHAVPAYRAEYNYSLDTFSNVLQDQGYTNGYFGKWHVERSHNLAEFGYAEYLTERTIPSIKTTAIKKTILSNPGTGYEDKIVGGVYAEAPEVSEEFFVYEKAMNFIERSIATGKPFCSFISTYAPHDPYTVPKSVYDLYEGMDIALPENWADNLVDKPNIYKRLQQVWKNMTIQDIKEIRRYYFTYCTLVDMQIGRLVAYLKQKNIYDDTLIILLSDHGDLQGSHGLFCKGVPSFEEAYKIPLILKFPLQKHAGKMCNGYISTCDIAPTMLEIVGAPELRNRTHGRSVVRLLEGKESEKDTYCMAEFFGQRYAFTQRIVWKNQQKYVFNGFDWDEFYDLRTDPYEMKNQINNPDYRERILELADLMQHLIVESDDITMNETQYFTTRIAPIGPHKSINPSEYSIYNKQF